MPNESKHDRFIRIAPKRTKEVLRRLRILGNCANRSAYEYTPEEVEKIFTAIQRQLDETRAGFKQRETREVDFSL